MKVTKINLRQTIMGTRAFPGSKSEQEIFKSDLFSLLKP